MGLWELFSRGKPSEAAIAKQVAKVREQYAKPEYRRMAMDKLLSYNTKESIAGLLTRFSVVVQSPHWDEEEKQWLVGELIARKEIAKDVLVDFVMKANEVTYAISALSKICSPEELNAILANALKNRSPDDYRSHQAKSELIAAFEEHEVAGLAQLLEPYLHDHNDDVKCMTVDVLSSKKAESAFSQMAKILTEDYHSSRVLRHVASAVHRLKIPVDPALPLAKEVLEDFQVKDGYLVVRKADI